MNSNKTENNDIDIHVDWLYKGKFKLKRKQISSLNTTTTTASKGNNNINIDTSTNRNNLSGTTTSINSHSNTGTATPVEIPLRENSTNPGSVKTRNRSVSISNAALQNSNKGSRNNLENCNKDSKGKSRGTGIKNVSTSDDSNSKSSDKEIRRSLSLNEKFSSSTKPTSSTTTSTISSTLPATSTTSSKSIFGSIFNKKKLNLTPNSASSNTNHNNSNPATNQLFTKSTNKSNNSELPLSVSTKSVSTTSTNSSNINIPITPDKETGFKKLRTKSLDNTNDKNVFINSLINQDLLEQNDHHAIYSPIPFENNHNTILDENISISDESNTRNISNNNINTENIEVLIDNINKIPIKRVTFSVDKFVNDPPQQLPTRKPKQGNILIPSDMTDELPSIQQGISGISNNSNPSTNPSSSSSSSSTTSGNAKNIKDTTEYKVALDIHRRMLVEALKHQEEAHLAAVRIANEVANYEKVRSHSSTHNTNSTNTNTNSEVVENVHNIVVKEIDRPIHLHEHHFESESDSLGELETSEMTLDIIYTRCCHLREILPIASTLRQVKGRTAPLQILKFLNPKPTLVDILSFCDFISITPINTIIFDNVNLSSEMFKILIKSIYKSKVIEKLSLRNVIIDKENWLLFCKFLLINKSITKIDLSQTHQKFKITDYSTNKLIDPNDLYCLRHKLNWNLLINVITKREGKPIEELLLNGIKFTQIPLTICQNLLNALSLQKNSTANTRLRLGIASSDISIDCLKIILIWMSSKNHIGIPVQGVDISHNDISNFVKTLVSRLSSLPFDTIEYFTFNNCQINSSYDMALLLKYLSKLPNLKFLDLSNMPQIFPDILPYIYKYLPRFVNLKRFHLDNNNLTFKQMAVVCNILMKCQNLSHISLMQPSSVQQVPITSGDDQLKTMDVPINIDDTAGNNESLANKPFSRNNVWATIYGMVKNLPNLIALDVNYDQASEEIKSRIALCLMRNMNKAMDSNFQIDELSLQDDLLFDGTLITDSADAVFVKLSNLNELMINNDNSQNKDIISKKYLLKKYFENLQRVHEKVLHEIDTMFEKRNNAELTLQSKENLVRLSLLEKNLAHILDLFVNTPQLAQILTALKVKMPCIQNKHFESSQQQIMENDNQQRIMENNMETNMETDNSTVTIIPEATRPHLMATDSGRTIDVFTGKPVLFRRSSTTSIHGKEQEQEEGELHKWGFFVQQQHDIYPGNIAETHLPPPSGTPASTIQTTDSSPTTPTTPTNPSQSSQKTLITKIPSGHELRSAIIKAKGIDSIEDLIQNVSDEQVTLDTIYGDSVKVTETYDKLIQNLSVSRNK